MSEKNEKSLRADRRGFLKIGGASVLGAFIASKILTNSDVARAAGAAPAAGAGDVDPKDPQAVSLGYTVDAKKVDTKKFPKRAGKDGAKQFCYNCQFYQNASGDPAKSQKAPCQIFGGKNVHSHAWCNTWTQNPNVKS